MSQHVKNLKYLEEEEARRRHRNEAIRFKIQEIKIRASVEASRSEVLRQIQNEHRALIQKYLSERKLPNMNDSLPQPSERLTVRPMPRTVPLKSDPVLVSIGINTDLTGPVMPVQGENTTENEKADTKTTLHWNSNKPVLTHQLYPAQMNSEKGSLSREVGTPKFYQSYTRNPTGTENVRSFPAPTLHFQDISTSETEVMTGTDECRRLNEKRFQSKVGPVASAVNKYLAEEGSDTTTTVSEFPRKESLSISQSMEPEKSFTDPSKGFNRKEVTNLNETKTLKESESETGDRSDSPTASLGESMMDTNHHQNENSFSKESSIQPHSILETERAEGSKETDILNESKSNSGKNNEGNGKNCGLSDNQSHSSSSNQQFQEEAIEDKGEEEAPIKAPLRTPEIRNEIGNNSTSETDDLSYNDSDRAEFENFENRSEVIVAQGSQNETKAEGKLSRNVENQVKKELEEGRGERISLSASHLKLKVGYEDSETEKSEKELSETDQKLAEGVERSRNPKKSIEKEKEEDDDLDDFFDL